MDSNFVHYFLWLPNICLAVRGIGKLRFLRSCYFFREVYGTNRDEITRKLATLLDKELCDL